MIWWQDQDLPFLIQILILGVEIVALLKRFSWCAGKNLASICQYKKLKSWINVCVFCFFFLVCFCRTLDVSRTASREITLVRLFVRPFVRLFVRPSLSFLKLGSSVFFDIVHDDSWPKFVGPNFDQMAQNWARNLVFCHFLKFGSLFFLEIAYSDSLQQYLTSSRGKT